MSKNGIKEFTVTKALNGDTRNVLQQAVEWYYKDKDSYRWPWLLDFDEEKKEVYFELYTDGVYTNYVADYTMNSNDTAATLSDTAYPVTRKSTYERIPEEFDVEKSVSGADGLTKAVTTMLDKYFSGTKKSETVNKSLSVIKQFEDEQMVAIEKLYINPITEIDLVGDTMTLEDTRGMVASLNKAIDSEGGIQSGLFHKANADDVFTVEKAWVAETDCMIGETLIEEGQPLIKVQFHNTAAWELRKSGELTGISIGARATEIEEL